MPQTTTDPPLDPAAVSRIRRVTVSGAIDEAVHIVHDEPRPLFLVALLVAAAPIALALYLGLTATEDLALGFTQLGEGRQVDLVPLLKRVALVTFPLLFVAYRVAEPLALGALVTLCAGRLTGRRVTAGNAVRNSLRLGIPLVIMWLLRWISIQFGTMLCYGPGILLAGLFFSALPVIVVERIGPLRALGRSIELNKQRLGDAILLVLLLGLIEALIGQTAQVLPHGLPQAVGVGLLHSCILVLYAAACTVFYFSGRCQKEDFDLQLWVQTVVRRDELDPSSDATRLFSPQATS